MSSKSSTASENIRNIIERRQLLDNILMSPHLYKLGDVETQIYVDSETEKIFNIPELTADLPESELDEDELTTEYNNRNGIFKGLVDFIKSPLGILRGVAVSLISLSSVSTKPVIVKRIVSVKRLFARVQKISLILNKFIEMGGRSENISSLRMILKDMQTSVKKYEQLKQSIQDNIMLSDSQLQEIRETVKSAKSEISITDKEREELNELVVNEKVSDTLVDLLCDLDYLFLKLSKLAKSIEKSRIQKSDAFFTQLNKFAKEMVNEEFNTNIKSVITEKAERIELKNALEMSELEIQLNMQKINELMVGLSQYDDICNTRETDSPRSGYSTPLEESYDFALMSSRHNSPNMDMPGMIPDRSPSKSRKRSRRRSPNRPNKRSRTRSRSRSPGKKMTAGRKNKTIKKNRITRKKNVKN